MIRVLIIEGITTILVIMMIMVVGHFIRKIPIPAIISFRTRVQIVVVIRVITVALYIADYKDYKGYKDYRAYPLLPPEYYVAMLRKAYNGIKGYSSYKACVSCSSYRDRGR